MQEIRFIELFCGIGGFRYGLEQTENFECTCFSEESEQEDRKKGWKWIVNEQGILFRSRQKPSFRCVWANDIDRYACQVYRKNFGEKELYEGDIKAVNANTLPDHDLLTAGFPCQSFSVAGKRKGFEDTRGTLFYEILRVAEAKRPVLLLLENVKGLLSHDEGLTFQVILESLGELGYWVEWQVLNSKHFGVPQNRERVFIIGHLGERGGREVFPVFEAGGNIDGACGEAQGAGTRLWAANPLGIGIGGSFGERNLTANTLSRRYYKDGSENLIQLNDGYLPRDENGKPQLLPIGYRRVRKLTPVECERLQAFPDNWTTKGIDKNGKEVAVSDTQRYKCLGNAVTTSVVSFLGWKILNTVEGE